MKSGHERRILNELQDEIGNQSRDELLADIRRQMNADFVLRLPQMIEERKSVGLSTEQQDEIWANVRAEFLRDKEAIILSKQQVDNLTNAVIDAINNL